MNRRYRKTIIAGNWKMNKTVSDARDFIGRIAPVTAKASWCDVVLCVPYTDIQAAVRAVKGSGIAVAAQNMHEEPRGAFTGEISAPMLVEAGVKYVILGHSERRSQYGDTDFSVNKKVHAALASGLRPIVCLGESLALRDAGVTIEHIRLQLKIAVHNVPAERIRRVCIAYEPLWAIGTGVTATAEQAGQAGRAIRDCLREMYGARCARSVSVLYGGSVTPGTAGGLFALPDIDGGLIGGASLVAEDFVAIVNAANQ